MTYRFNHFNFNVTNLDKSIEFYNKALGLKETHRIEDKSENAFTIVYLGDGKSGFELELTYLKSHPNKYDLGECEFHLALSTEDYESSLKKHQEMNCVCFINEDMGIYFIEDPDGYWVEIIPAKNK